MAIQQNPDLPISYQVPGVYAFLSRAGAAPPAINRRLLILAYKTSAGQQPAGTPKRVLSESDVIAAAGVGSEAHRIYRAYVAQGNTTGADIWLVLLNAPSGTAQTRKITILQAPTGAVVGSSGTGAVSGGYVSARICGYRFDSTIASGDTYATIAANLAAQIQAQQDLLPCTCTVVGATITLTARHAALSSADLPVQTSFSNAGMGVAASPGTIAFASTAGGAGAASVQVATQSAGIAIASGDTLTVSSAALTAAINNANAFPVTAAEPSSATGTITLYYVEERVFNWASLQITSGITQTLTASWGAEAAGLPSAATPSLSSVLGTIAAQSAFRLWLTPFSGAGSFVTAAGTTQAGSTSDYSVLGTLSSHIETQGNGLSCKGQILLLADTRALAVAGTVPSNTTPALTLSPRYFVSWCAASPQQAYETSARVASMIMSRLDYPNFNYAGQPLLTDGRTPYLVPHAAVRPSDNDCNAAMLSYFLAPLRSNDQGQVAVVSGRTTAKPTASLDFRYSWWGTALADDFIRDDLRASLPLTIAGKTLKSHAPANTQFATTPEAILTAVASRVEYYASLDIFDGKDDLIAANAAQVNLSLSSRVDVKLAKRFAVPAEQISIYTELAA
jgi:phage tail sheath gpL-like